MNLKPCPFCESTKVTIIFGGLVDTGEKGGKDYYVQCADCSGDGPWGTSNDDAAELWNKAHRAELVTIKGGASGATTVYSESRAEQNAKDAARYAWIWQNGMPCQQGDECGACAGPELDAVIDAAIERTGPHSKP